MAKEETHSHRHAPVMFLSIDRHGRVADASSSLLALLGYGRDQMLGRPSSEFLRETSESTPDGDCTDALFRAIAKDGRELDLLVSATTDRDESGAVARTLAVLTDVTGRNELEALRHAEIFSRAFRASGTILLVSTLATGRFIEVNEAFERILGFRREEVIGRESSRIKIWTSPRERVRYVQLLLEQGKVHDLEVRIRSKSGGAIAGLLSGELVEVNGEKCILSIITDITERKRAAEELEVLHTNLAAHALALEIANEELEAFSYTVSHDLRKPLTAISGYCQVLQSIYLEESDEECKRYLDEILLGTVRMSQLMDTLLEFSRLNHGELQRETVDLSAVAADAAAELRASDAGRRVVIEIEEGLAGDGDATLLRVVLDNLIGNAWKYTARKEEGRIEVGSAQINGKSAYFVRDNGVGFNQTGAERLFNAFHRQPGAESFNGFGIGLATVKRIIGRHGGRVWAEGEPGNGATFYFTIT